MPAFAYPVTLADGDTASGANLEQNNNALENLVNVVPADPTTGQDENNIRYMAFIYPLPFILSSDAGLGVVAAGAAIAALPYAGYLVHISAHVQGGGGGVDSATIQLEWSTDGFATTKNLFVAASQTITESTTVATEFSAGQLQNVSIPQGAMVRMNISGVVGVVRALTVIPHIKMFHKFYDANL